MAAPAPPTVVYPTRHVPLARDGDEPWRFVAELATVLALGQRVLVIGPPRSGVTSMLQLMASSLLREVPHCTVDVVLVDRDIEEFLEWRQTLPDAHVHGAASDAPPDEQSDVSHVFMNALARAEDGEDRVVVVDTIAALARALNVSMPFDERVLSGGIMQVALRSTRDLFSRGRAFENGGSLTIIAGAQSESTVELDEIVLEELVGTGNMELRLSAAASAAGLWPPVDLERSGARHAELIVGDQEARRRAQLQAKVVDHGLLAGLALLLEELRTSGSLAALLELQDPP